MNISVVSFDNLTDAQRQNFMSFLAAILSNQKSTADQFSGGSSAKDNMWGDDWLFKPHTLPHLLYKTDRFASQNGEFHIIFDGDTIIGCGGIYLSEFDRRFAFAGTRTWVNSVYRNKLVLRDSLLATQKKWAIDHGCGAVGLCFNMHNRNLLEVFKRIRLGEDKNRINSRKEHHLFYTGMIEVAHTVTIQYSKQWVVYELLDPMWSFDWTTISNE